MKSQLILIGLCVTVLSKLQNGVQEGSFSESENKIIQKKCGIVPTLPQKGSKFFVMHGKNVTQAQMYMEAPWVVSINYDEKDGVQQPNMSCSGVLISPRHVLTAAHCQVYSDKGTQCNDETLVHKPNFIHNELPRFRIRVGSICGHRQCKEGRTYKVKRLIYPASYTNGDNAESVCKPYNGDTEDIAIYELSKDVQGVSYACLGHKTRKNVELTNYGYGLTLESKEERFMLKKHTTKYVDCSQYWEPSEISLGMECTRYAKENTSLACVGDSGGPIVAKYNHRTYSVGVLSLGTACPDGKKYGSIVIKGDIITSVPYYSNWICKWTGICPEGTDPNKDERPTTVWN